MNVILDPPYNTLPKDLEARLVRLWTTGREEQALRQIEEWAHEVAYTLSQVGLVEDPSVLGYSILNHVRWITGGSRVYELSSESIEWLLQQDWDPTQLDRDIPGLTYVARFNVPLFGRFRGYYQAMILDEVGDRQIFLTVFHDRMEPDGSRRTNNQTYWFNLNDDYKNGTVFNEEDVRLIRLVLGLSLAIANQAYREQVLRPNRARKKTGRKDPALRYAVLTLDPTKPSLLATRRVQASPKAEHPQLDPEDPGTHHASSSKKRLHVCHEHFSIKWMKAPQGEVLGVKRREGKKPLYAVKRPVREHIRGSHTAEDLKKVR